MTLTRSPAITPTVFVAVVEWASADGDREPVVFTAIERQRAEHELAAFFASDFAEHEHCYYDDSAAFMESPREWGDGPDEPPFGPLAAADWLTGLRAATTAPWFSIIESPVLAGGESK